jgi:hypothetical protein
MTYQSGKPKEITCQDCGEKRIRYRSSRCQDCYLKHQRAERVKSRGIIKCTDCGRSFTPWHKSDKYCFFCNGKRFGFKGSPRKQTEILAAKCQQCGSGFTQPARYYIKRGTPKFCSQECTYAHRRGLRGKPSTSLWKKCWKVSAKEARDLGGHICCICHGVEPGAKQIPVDHIVPRRLMERWGFDPHHQGNLACLCTSCHGKKTAAEWMLFKGDLVGFVSALAGMSYPKARVLDSFKCAEFSQLLVERVYGR